jgi:hypothetical protein
MREVQKISAAEDRRSSIDPPLPNSAAAFQNAGAFGITRPATPSGHRAHSGQHRMNVGRTLAQAAGDYLGSTLVVSPEELDLENHDFPAKPHSMAGSLTPRDAMGFTYAVSATCRV